MLRLQLADLLEAEEDWLEAAKVLTTVPLESPGMYALAASPFAPSCYLYTG